MHPQIDIHKTSYRHIFNIIEIMIDKGILIPLTKDIEKITGKDSVFADDATSALYCYDSSLAKSRPELVVNVTKTNQISPLLKLLYKNKVPFTARGAATNLSGGTIALKGGAVLNLAPLNRILEISTKKEYALVEPGVVNLTLQNELEKFGFFYAPDPASQIACTIGGNFGENAGGPRCLKYGVTSDNILEAEFITAEGKELYLKGNDNCPDLLRLMIGSEGTLGIATKIKLKIIKKSPCIKTVLAGFDNMEKAMQSVSDVIAAGIIPCTLEAMDKLTIEATEKHTKAGYPVGRQAVLLMEFDGDESSSEKEMTLTHHICLKNKALDWIVATDENTRQKLLLGRKGAFAAMARLAPNVSVEDGVVPRPKLAKALSEIRKILDKYNLKAGLVFHAGDGNIHPNIILDERNLYETSVVKKAGREILKKCTELGGTISGEHGIGSEKRFAMKWLYTDKELDIFRKIKKSFDPENLANPDKIIPLANKYGKNETSIRPRFPGVSAKSKEISRLISERYKTKTKSFIICNKTKIPEIPTADTVDLSVLKSVLNIDRQNYTLTVEAGIKLNDLYSELEKQNLYLPLPQSDGSLGGMLACNEWHPVKNIILAMTLLFPDGVIASFGTDTVKNVSGYDVCRLMIGSWGAYAIILNATLKLSAKKDTTASTISKPIFAKPNIYHIRLKKTFDEFNLFNPHLFKL